MLQIVKRFSLLMMLAAFAPAAWGFALLKPVGFGPDATWQIVAWGYSPDAYIDPLPAGPANIGEGYRRNTPVMYYTYSPAFLDYFGSNGPVAIDQAFAIMSFSFSNSITGPVGLDGYSSDLGEFSTYTEHLNNTAYALGLNDLKSETLYLLVEQMGLAQPDRYVWTIRDAGPDPGVTTPKCPEDEIFRIVQRNYDIVPSPLGETPPAIQYSSYINGELYSYDILDWPECKPPPNVAWTFRTLPFPVNPFVRGTTIDSPVASGLVDLGVGDFYTGLTRDDMGGLRYLLTTNNINTEDVAAGALLLTTNNLPQVAITTQPISALLTAAQTNTAAG